VRFCATCGKENNDSNTKICIFCGAKIEDDSPQTGTQPKREMSITRDLKPQKKHVGIIVLIILLSFFLVIGSGFIFTLIKGKDMISDNEQFLPSYDKTEKEVVTINKSGEQALDESSELETAKTHEIVTETNISEETTFESTTKSSSNFAQIIASSELPGYPAEKIVDGKNDTAWGSEIDDYMMSSVSIPFGSIITIYGISLKNGNWNSQYDLIRNSRVKELVVEFDDGSNEVLTVSDSMLLDFSNMVASDGEQLVFKKPHATSTMKLTISNVHLGAESVVFITGVTVNLQPVDVYTTETSPTTEREFRRQTTITTLNNTETELSSKNAPSNDLKITPISEFKYQANAGGISITEYTGTSIIVRIPNTIEGEPIRYISEGVFTGIKEIYIPDSVLSIGERAFQNSGLTSITLPANLITIGSYAFQRTGLTSITLPENLIQIGNYAFQSSALKSVIFDEKLEKIGSNAFDYCTGITNIVLPDNLTSIGEHAFRRCSLETITIPDSVTFIGHEAFIDCPLKSINYKGITYYKDNYWKGAPGNVLNGLGNPITPGATTAAPTTAAPLR